MFENDLNGHDKVAQFSTTKKRHKRIKRLHEISKRPLIEMNLQRTVT